MNHEERRKRRMRVVRLIEKGLDRDTILATLGINQAMYYRCCHENEIKPPKPKRALDLARKIAEAVDGGMTRAEARVAFQRSSTTVNHACAMFGKAGDRTPQPASNSYKVVLLLLAGKHERDIARKIGVSHQRVNQIKKTAAEAGFKFPENEKAK